MAHPKIRHIQENRGSFIKRLLRHRHRKPASFFVAFALVGTATLLLTHAAPEVFNSCTSPLTRCAVIAVGPHKIESNGTTLYDSITGTPFTPRGADYIRIATDSTGKTYHSTFEPGQYNAITIQNTLNSMKADGYNVIRVFIDPGNAITPSHGISTASSSTTPINAAYIANVSDFVKKAAADNIYTIPVVEYVPSNNYYAAIVGTPMANVQGNNVAFLEPGYVKAKEAYITQFINALDAGTGNLAKKDVLAYETDNEVFFDASKPPFSTMSGTLTSLNGVAYNMAIPAQRQQAADANLVSYSDDMKQAITTADPNALLMMGFFTNNAVGKTGFNGLTTYCSTACKPTVDYRVPGRPAAVSQYGDIDIIDMHTYPTDTTTYSLKNDLASSEYTLFEKPYILGEFGAQKSVYANNITAAALGMKALQVTSCTLNAKGWLFWTWDTDMVTSLANQGLFYSLNDSSGSINGQLAPIARGNACT